MPIDSLKQDPDNARLHPTRNLQAIEVSLKQFGQFKPVVARDGLILAGNGTWQAAKNAGWTKLAAVEIEGLNVEEARALGLMDNKAGDLAEWDFGRLAGLLQSMPEGMREFTGFADFEIEPLLAATFKPATPSEAADGVTTNMVNIRVTPQQNEVIQAAIAKVRAAEEATEETLKDGRALELICADYTAG